MAWKDEVDKEELKFARSYLGLGKEDAWNWALLRAGMGSVSDLFVMQMQDCLGFGKEARMNTPGVLGGNWQWRLLPGQLDKKLAKKLLRLTAMYGRAPEKKPGE